MKLRPKYEWCRRNGGARKTSVLNLSHGESVLPSRCIILRLTISKSQSRNQRCQCTMAFDRARIANKWRVIVAGWRANHWYASLLQTIRWVSSTLTLPLNIFRIPSSLHTRKVLISMHWIFQDIPRKILKDIIYRNHIFSFTPHQQEDFQGISSLGIVFSYKTSYSDNVHSYFAPCTLLYLVSLLFGCWDDDHRNPNINNKDNLVGD